MSSPIINLEKYTIVLASNSPRRKELLKGLGLNFTTRTKDNIDESYPEEINPLEVAEYLALKKAKQYQSELGSNELIITADTIVINNKKILGKPDNRQEAIEMIQQLSGRTHKVVTGVCVNTKQKSISFSSETNVTFCMLSEQEITFYVDNYKPYDKAGSYGIQEWIGYVAVESIQGSYYNVMGLPIQKLYQELKKI